MRLFEALYQLLVVPFVTFLWSIFRLGSKRRNFKRQIDEVKRRHGK